MPTSIRSSRSSWRDHPRRDDRPGPSWPDDHRRGCRPHRDRPRPDGGTRTKRARHRHEAGRRPTACARPTRTPSRLGQDPPATRRANAITVIIGLTPIPVGKSEPSPTKSPRPRDRRGRTADAAGRVARVVPGSAPIRTEPIWWAEKTTPRFGAKSKPRAPPRTPRSGDRRRRPAASGGTRGR